MADRKNGSPGKKTGTEMNNAFTTVLLCGCCLAAAQAAEPVPYGHKDFYPTAERPIGHRGDGNGWYPGATPVVEWWEGTVSEIEMAIPDRGAGKSEATKVLDIADSGAKNILWRTEMPSWANAQPIVVGNRVFSYGEPDYVFGVDARDGKLLWQKRLSPWRCANLPEAEVRRCERLYDVHQALLTYEKYRMPGPSTTGRPPDAEAFASIHDTFVKTCLPRMVKELKEVDPKTDWDAPAQGTIAQSKAVLAAAQAGISKTKLPGGPHLSSGIARRIAEIGGVTVPLGVLWGHMTGFQMSCPVSDGERLYVQMGQGQVAALDLDGRLLWARLTRRGIEHSVRSPLLADGVLVTAMDETVLRGWDAATGKLRWEAPNPGARLFIGADQAVRLGRGHEALHMVVSNTGRVIRVRDGKELGQLPYLKDVGKEKILGGPSIVSVAQDDGSVVVLKGAEGLPLKAYRNIPDGDGLRFERPYDLGPTRTPYHQGFVATDRFALMQGRAFTVADGRALPDLGRRFGYYAFLVAGDYALGHGAGGLSNAWHRRRPDEKILGRFTVADVGNPASPRLLADRNVLGGTMTPRFPPAERFLPELWANPAYVNSCGGRISHFIHTDTAVTALGDRLFIRSTGHLYCVGPAVKGTPKDDPKVVADIRAATSAAEIAKYLDSKSAQYRYEAVKNCSDGKTALPEAALKRLAVADPYEEIRAAAIRALGMQVGRPGHTLLRKQIAEAVDPKWGRWQDKSGLHLTLRALGAHAEPVLVAMCRADDEAERIAAAAAIATVGPGGEALRDALLASLEDGQLAHVEAEALSRWPADAAVMEGFTAILNQRAHGRIQPLVYRYLLCHQPADSRARFLQAVVARNPDGRTRHSAITELAALAADDASALAALKAIDPGDDQRLADGLKKAIEGIEKQEKQ